MVENSLWRIEGYSPHWNIVHLRIKEVKRLCTEIFLFYVKYFTPLQFLHVRLIRLTMKASIAWILPKSVDPILSCVL